MARRIWVVEWTSDGSPWCANPEQVYFMKSQAQRIVDDENELHEAAKSKARFRVTPYVPERTKRAKKGAK